jgi:hypothetical protein
MSELAAIAPAFVEMAHRTVWASVATVAPDGRPRSRILHPLWEWDGEALVGWIATGPTPVKRADLAAHPQAAVTYWSPSQDTCTAHCDAELVYDDDTRTRLWEAFKQAPAPVGYDPAIVPVWTGPTADTFAALRLEPYQLRVMPGTVLLSGQGEVLRWSAR